MLDPTSLIILHVVMMWTVAAAFWMIVLIERRWDFPWQWALGFTIMPLIMVIGGVAERWDVDSLRAMGFIIGVAGPFIYVDGVRVFVRQTPPLTLWRVIGVAFLAGVLYATYVTPSLNGRLLVFQVTLLVGSAYNYSLSRLLNPEDHPLGRPLAIVTSIAPMIAASGHIAAMAAGAFDDAPEGRDLEITLLLIAATIVALFKALDSVVLVAERMAAKIGREARVDALTGLATRRAFDQTLAKELERRQRSGRPLSVILFDVDHFKAVNDTHGHDVGDLALQKVAECARAAVRPSDLAARLGGDEFAVLLPETDPGAAAAVAQRILDGMRALALPSPKGDIRLTGSFGVGAAVAGEGSAAADLIKRADEALYVVKRQGRNGVAAAATV